MKRAGIAPNLIGWIALSHLHGDHFAGIPFMVLDGQFRGRDRPVVGAGPPGTRERVEAAMEVLFPGSTQGSRRFVVEVKDLHDRRPAHLGPARITPFAADHASGAPSYALRIEYGNRTIAYSGDTAWTDNLVDVARGADVFVCEAYFFTKKVSYHLDYGTLREHADNLDCRRLILTHMHADMLEHLDEVDCEWAEDGQIIDL
jgi:ribonuclease BN (tRNA processing enzyme)